jgi:hypothetical protein
VSAPPRWLRTALWSAVALQVALVLCEVAIEAHLGRTGPPTASGAWVAAANGVSMLAFAAVGALLLVRRPANRVGWLFCVANLGWALVGTSGAYVRWALTPGADLPGTPAAVWLYTWPGALSLGVYLLLIMVFPDGRFASARWDNRGKAVAGACVAVAAALALRPGRVDSTIEVAVDNPLGLSGLPGVVVTVVAELGLVILLGLLIVALASMVQRYRASAAMVRAQLRWFIAAVTVLIVFVIAQVGVFTAYPDYMTMPSWARMVNLAAILSGGAIPVAAAVAILRYRLYAIDRIVSRTLSYGLVTAGLAVLYAAGVVALTPALAGVGGGSELAVAGATLIVAAAFRPLRGWVQRLVDRRFNRARYDAHRTMEGFRARLRDEVELEPLTGEILAVVRDTVQPTATTLWLRQTGRATP